MTSVAPPHPAWISAYQHPGQWDLDLPPLTLPDMFVAMAKGRGDAPMLDFLGRKYSYSETLSGVRRVAKGLQDMGLKRGDRVGLFLPNVPHYVAAYYGAMLAGATVVNFSPLYTVDELRHQVEDSGTRFLFTLSAKALLPNALAVLERSSLEALIVGSVAGALPRAKSVLYRLFKRGEVSERPDDPRISAFSKLIANDGTFVAADPSPDDVALIQYTGGTTGVPKGAMLTHQNLSANARQVNAIDPRIDEVDRIMGVLPFFHVFANTCVLNRTVENGGEIVMLPRFDAAQCLAAITRTQPRSMPGVPTMYQALLDHPALAKTDFSSLRVCISGGAPMPAELQRKFEAATGARLVEGYGLTESSGVVSTNPYEGLNKPGTIGQPLPMTNVRLVDKENPNSPPSEGDPGEMVIAGPQIMKGYWRRPDADGETFIAIDGQRYLRTGDVGEIDADGYISVVDRLKDMIAVGGFKVFPSQIEDILYTNSAVREALVIGVPDAYLGERPRAYVTLEPDTDIDADRLVAWLNSQLGKHERVESVVIREELPKTMIGKLDRKALRAEIGDAGIAT